MENCYSCHTKKEPEYLAGGCLISRDGFLHQKRIMNCNVLIFVLEGTLYIGQSGNEFEVSAGQVIVLGAGEEHQGIKKSSGKLVYYWVHFLTEGSAMKVEQLPENMLPQEITYLLPEYQTVPNPQRVNMLFRQLIDFSRQENRYTERFLNSALDLLLMELTQEFLDGCGEDKKNISPLIYQVSEWIRQNCHKLISIHDIADEFRYNPKYLSVRFKAETGKTLLQYLNESRIHVAKTLLANQNISIKEAAYSSGFHDEKYFMRLFRQSEGMTPMQYKNAFYKI